MATQAKDGGASEGGASASSAPEGGAPVAERRPDSAALGTLCTVRTSARLGDLTFQPDDGLPALVFLVDGLAAELAIPRLKSRSECKSELEGIYVRVSDLSRKARP